MSAGTDRSTNRSRKSRALDTSPAAREMFTGRERVSETEPGDAMSQREVHIISYFSLPTDLADAMRSWPEFVSGKDYSVQLRSQLGTVTVQLHEL